MIELPTDDGPFQRFRLVEKQRLERGPDNPEMETTASIALSKPLVIPVDSELAKDDAELLAFWTARQATHRYDYVTFRCSLDPDPAAPFEKVWITLSLAAEGGEEAIAWSMTPRTIADVTEVSENAKVGGALKLLSAEISGGTKTSRKSLFLQARGEHGPRPSWLLAATPASNIEGMFAFHLVVQAPRRAEVACHISAEAVVATRAFWIFQSQKPVSGGPAIEFRLPKDG